MESIVLGIASGLVGALLVWVGIMLGRQRQTERRIRHLEVIAAGMALSPTAEEHAAIVAAAAELVDENVIMGMVREHDRKLFRDRFRSE